MITKQFYRNEILIKEVRGIMAQKQQQKAKPAKKEDKEEKDEVSELRRIIRDAKKKK